MFSEWVANRIRDRDNAAGIGDNAAGIGDNSAEIGDEEYNFQIVFLFLEDNFQRERGIWLAKGRWHKEGEGGISPSPTPTHFF